MSTLNELTYSLKEAISSFSDDSTVSLEYLAFLIKNGRAMLISQKYSTRGNVIPQKLRQSFHKRLEIVDGNEFVLGLSSILRTVDPIPYPLESFNLKNNIRINAGSYTDLNFTFIQAERAPFVGRSKWNANNIYVFLGSDYRLYFISNNPRVNLLEDCKVQEVTEDPETAWLESMDYNPAKNFWTEVEYPIEEEMVTQLTDLIFKKLTLTLQIPKDISNDSASETS